MAEVGERLDKVEERLGGVEQRLGAVETGLKEVQEEVGGLRAVTNNLRILGEKNAEDIKRIAEVQTHHGKKLDEIGKALEPLARIDAFVTAVAHVHEKRITALEHHTGLSKKTTV